MAEPGSSQRESASLLPMPLTPLLGREREVAEVSRLLRQPAVRLVTLVGPGGIGKTRLALAVADGLSGDFPDGVHFVDLAPLVDPALVPLAIARQLGLPEAADRSPLDQLIAALQGQRRLLVLDNWERLVAAAPQVAALLAGCPALTVLATSRVPLELRGERQFAPPPLAVPARRPDGRLVVPPLDELARIPAVALFLDRARAMDHAFALTAANAEAVAAICHRLEGLPLAIELAAARCRVLTPGELRDRLAAPLDLLTSGPRDLPDRQRTLRATIAWSADLLAPTAQALFRRLAVFRGGFSLEAAEAMGSLDETAVLVEQSLVRPLHGPNGEPRFGMLETIREYAGELLVAHGEDEAARAAHAAYFLALAERAFPHLRGAEQVVWLDRLEAEHANLRAALRWALECEPATVAALAEELWVFWWLRGHFNEGREWMGRALAVEELEPALRAKLLHGAGTLAHYQGDLPAAEVQYREALTTARAAGEMRVAAAALGNLGNLTMERGDLGAAEAFQEESLAIERELGNRQGVAMTVGNLGVLAWERGDLARAAELFTECLGLARELGDQESVALSLINLGEVARARSDPAAAERHYEEALSLMRQAGNRHGVAIALCDLAEVARERGDTPRAAALLHECMELARELGGAQRLAAYLEAVARLAVTAEPDGSARLYGATNALREANAMSLSRTEAELRERDLAVLRRRLGPAAFEAATSAGGALSPDAAIAEALVITESPALTAPPVVRKAATGDDLAARYGLRPREVEVLRLLVEGRSDREIADELSLSRGTVSNYVMTLLAKLDVTSRTAAAAMAVRDGLV